MTEFIYHHLRTPWSCLKQQNRLWLISPFSNFSSSILLKCGLWRQWVWISNMLQAGLHQWTVWLWVGAGRGVSHLQKSNCKPQRETSSCWDQAREKNVPLCFKNVIDFSIAFPLMNESPNYHALCSLNTCARYLKSLERLLFLTIFIIMSVITLDEIS